MTQVKLDTAKLLGFRLEAAGAKVGGKVGSKRGVKAGVKLGVKS